MIGVKQNIEDILYQVRRSKHVTDKIQIDQTYANLGQTVSLPKRYVAQYKTEEKVNIGDDCTAIPNPSGGGYSLFAAEGIISEFLEDDPWFAGYSAVMVNISDVLAMGGIPVAVIDVIWGENAQDLEEVWEGMTAASKAYDVPIVGGHTCYGASQKSLSVSILGTANKLLSGFDARPGQHVLMAVDMQGKYYEGYPFWNASTTTSPQSLQEKTSLLSDIAESGRSSCAKDISMGGLLGTLAMLGHTSQVGFNVHFENIIPPPDGDWVRWLTAFPSFGFVLTAEEEHVDEVIKLFESQNVLCHDIGIVKKDKEITVITPKEAYKFI